MDETIIKNWNDLVASEDIVYHLGDFGFFSQKQGEEPLVEQIRALISRLKGRIRLVKGNHDERIPNQTFRDAGMEEAYDRPILFGDFIIMSHEPVFLQAHSVFGNIHGHTHQNNYVSSKGKKVQNMYFNASVDVIQFRPVLLDSIFRKHPENEETLQ